MVRYAMTTLLLFLLMLVPIYAQAADRIMGTTAGTGVLEELSGAAASSIIGASSVITTGTEAPSTCTPGGENAFFLDTDTNALFYCSDTDTYAGLDTGQTVTLDNAFDNGKIINGANSLANCVEIGDGTTPMCGYTDSTLGPLWRPKTLSNTRTYIWTNFNWALYDIEGDSTMLVVDPDATDNDKYTWTSGYRPIKTLPLTADMLFPRGSSTVVTDTALISGGQVDPYVTTTDSDSDGFYRKLVMDPKWDGGTVTATITVINTNATPANAFRVDVSGECWPAGTAVGTTISTTGEQSAIITFGASGSCGGSACNQNDPASATTAAITINGTPAGGNYCGFQAQTHASGTTETVAGIKIVQMDIHYKISKGF